MKKAYSCAALLFALAAALTGCAQTQKNARATAFALGTVLDIQAEGPNAQEAIDAALVHISRRDALWSTRIETSDTARLNKEGQADISRDTYDLIAYAQDISSRLWDGESAYFDITVRPLIELYGMERWTEEDYEFEPPADELVQSTLPGVGFQLVGPIEPDPTGPIVNMALPEGTGIDLGGIAKGRCADEAAEILRAHGIENALMNLGGNVYVMGERPDGKPWRVGIRNPLSNDANSSFAELELPGGMAVVTSGDYQRYVMHEGRKYHHIIDPSTGYPADGGLAGVTVVCADSTLADALSTALYVAGVYKGFHICAAFAVDAIFVTQSGDVYFTEGLRDMLRITDNAFSPRNAL